MSSKKTKSRTWTLELVDLGIQAVLKSGNVQDSLEQIADAAIDDIYAQTSALEKYTSTGRSYYNVKKEHFTKWYSTTSDRGKYSIFGTVYQITRREEVSQIFHKVAKKYNVPK